jgi:hypothetical protein
VVVTGSIESTAPDGDLDSEFASGEITSTQSAASTICFSV